MANKSLDILLGITRLIIKLIAVRKNGIILILFAEKNNFSSGEGLQELFKRKLRK